MFYDSGDSINLVIAVRNELQNVIILVILLLFSPILLIVIYWCHGKVWMVWWHSGEHCCYTPSSDYCQSFTFSLHLHAGFLTVFKKHAMLALCGKVLSERSVNEDD